MAKWIVYGDTWYAAEVEADTQEEAENLALTKLMDYHGVRFNIQYVGSVLENA
jgi:hypothetical protein